MRGFRIFSTMAAMAVAAGLFASSALAEGPPPARPNVTPAPQTGVRIVLPSGAVIILPIEHDAPMTPGANRNHMVGEELC
jgi:hypothetical protein